MIRPPPRSTLFPHPPLSRSRWGVWGAISGPPISLDLAQRPVDELNAHRALAHRSEEHTSELQSQSNLVCRLLLEKKKKTGITHHLGAHQKIGVDHWHSTVDT